jgi:hypothetical protein
VIKIEKNIMAISVGSYLKLFKEFILAHWIYFFPRVSCSLKEYLLFRKTLKSGFAFSKVLNNNLNISFKHQYLSPISPISPSKSNQQNSISNSTDFKLFLLPGFLFSYFINYVVHIVKGINFSIIVM